MRNVVAVVIAIAVVGCGARSALTDRDAPDGAPAAGGTDAGVDAGVDAGTDAGVDAGPAGGTCTAGERFEVVVAGGRIAHPRLARVGEAGLLVYTMATTVYGAPIDLRGRARDVPAPIGPGIGGTLIGRTLGDVVPGFTLSAPDADGVLQGARFDESGRLVGAGPIGRATDGGRRPLVVLTSILAANGWVPPGGMPAGEGFVQDLRTRESTDLRFEGGPPAGAATARPDTFRAAVPDGDGAIVTRIDSRGVVLERQRFPMPPTTFPVFVQDVRLVETAEDAVVLAGGTVRALIDAVVHVVLGDREHNFFLANDELIDADAAYDPSTGWLAVAAGIRHDAGISRAPEPHVFFFAMARDGRNVELVIDGPLDAEVHPAILATGLPDAPFLVVWEGREIGAIDGVHVYCD